jgi:quercetin dioxygenase-like cupin family protein
MDMPTKHDLDIRPGMRTVRLSLAAGETVKTHHSALTVAVVCTGGRGRLVVGDEAHPLQSGVVVCMAPRAPHSVHADADEVLELVVVHAALAE